MFKSFMYIHPLVYDFGIQFLYWGALRKLTPLIGEGKTVFEPACGYGRITRYLPKDCAYRGIDLNQTFIRYGQKKGLSVSTGDIFDESLYPDSRIVLLCDILHHLPDEKMKQLIDIGLRHSREKLIIVEPAFVSIASAKNPISRALGRLFSLADADGINKISRWLSEEDYYRLFSHIESKPRVQEIVVHKHHFHYFVEVLPR